MTEQPLPATTNQKIKETSGGRSDPDELYFIGASA
jgi:hypothetical protein